MADDSDLFETIASAVPFGEYMAKGLEVVQGMYNFGRSGQGQQAIEQLQQQVQAIGADLKNLSGKVDELNARVTQDENLARLRSINGYHRDIEGLAFELTHATSADEIAVIAKKASLSASSMTDDEDLWLWSDILHHPSPGGTEGTELTTPEFKVIPLPVYGLTVGLFSLASSLHIAKEPSAAGGYLSTFQTLADTVSVRPDWVDIEKPAKTLPEKIRASITVMPIAATNYPAGGKCTYGLECVNRIERTAVIVRTVTLTDSPAGSMCEAPPNLGYADETRIEDEYAPIQLLAVLEEMLFRLRTSGTLADPPRQDFPDIRAVTGALYAVQPDGDLVMYSFNTDNHLSTPFDWHTSGTVVGTGWRNYIDILSGYWNVLYAVQDDGAILWYEHDGAANEVNSWSGPKVVEAATIQIDNWIDWRISGGSGWMYQVRRSEGVGGGLKQAIPRITLESAYHAGYKTGEGSFSQPATLANQWSQYRIVFSGSNNVIFGISDDGRLWWHRHDPVHGSLEGPVEVGSGWDIFRNVFSSGNGMIFGIYPNGTMMGYLLNEWELGPHDGPATWVGPVPVGGPNWNGFQRIIPRFDEGSITVK
ncbi:tachylectin-related carbohydrate-binding protein [Streptomyces rubellomurinus]|nr:tachylectin-related carbohydrate-binding protein [Streptomyces rubellomurinus]